MEVGTAALAPVGVFLSGAPGAAPCWHSRQCAGHAVRPDGVGADSGWLAAPRPLLEEAIVAS